jgi:hypothetical protein
MDINLPMIWQHNQRLPLYVRQLKLQLLQEIEG